MITCPACVTNGVTNGDNEVKNKMGACLPFSLVKMSNPLYCHESDNAVFKNLWLARYSKRTKEATKKSETCIKS